MTGERSFAYAGLMRSLRRLEAIGGLLPDEGDQIRAAADSLLFAEDDARSAAYVGASFDELGSVKHALALIEGLVELGRWPAPMATPHARRAGCVRTRRHASRAGQDRDGSRDALRFRSALAWSRSAPPRGLSPIRGGRHCGAPGPPRATLTRSRPARSRAGGEAGRVARRSARARSRSERRGRSPGSPASRAPGAPPQPVRAPRAARRTASVAG